MKYSRKLDVLQEMAKACAGDARALYLIGLLAEHAEEEACSEAVLEWVGRFLPCESDKRS